MPKAKIGVFDSGVGGLSVAEAIKIQLPDYQIIFKNDAGHMPYGNKPVPVIYDFVRPIIRSFVDEDCEVIVVACNTVTTNLIERLRSDFRVPFVGMEPMIKPAAENTKSGVVCVCATPRTLQSERYQWLKREYAHDIKVLEPDCSDWAYMIEADSIDIKKVKDLIDQACDAGADQIVLGCTHYHWIEQLIRRIAASRATVIQPETAVIAQLKTILKQKNVSISPRSNL